MEGRGGPGKLNYDFPLQNIGPTFQGLLATIVGTARITVLQMS